MIRDEHGLTALELPGLYLLLMGNPDKDLPIVGWFRHSSGQCGVLQQPIGYMHQIQMRVEFKKP